MQSVGTTLLFLPVLLLAQQPCFLLGKQWWGGDELQTDQSGGGRLQNCSNRHGKQASAHTLHGIELS